MSIVWARGTTWILCPAGPLELGITKASMRLEALNAPTLEDETLLVVAPPAALVPVTVPGEP